MEYDKEVWFKILHVLLIQDHDLTISNEFHKM